MLLVAIVSFPTSSAWAQATVGSVTSVSGLVQVTRATAVLPATTGMAVQLNDRFTTGVDGHAVITLTDGSTLELAESGNLTIDQHTVGTGGAAYQTKVSLFAGIVRSVVNTAARGAAPNFEVHTPNAVAAARGTKYDTAYSENVTRSGFTGCNRFTDVAVYEGTVGLSNPTAAGAGEVTIPAGYETSVPCGQAPLSPGPLGLTGASSLGGSNGKEATGGVGAGPGVGGAPPPACPVCVVP